MELWICWCKIVLELKPAFTRWKTFFWFAVCLMGLTIREDIIGVTSIIRALGLDEKYYNHLLDNFHSLGIKLDKLIVLWTQKVLKLFTNPLLVNGRMVLIGDGIKIPKCGKQMPAVKKLHQESDSNTKPEYIMGHSFQAVALLVQAAQGFFAVPLGSQIHEGLIFSNRNKRTLLDKMVTLIYSFEITQNFYFVADAYYASKKIITPLLNKGDHLVTRVKLNAVAYYTPTQDNQKRKVGRPKKYGNKIKLRSLLLDKNNMKSAKSPVYNDQHLTIDYHSVDLLWRPVGIFVRFVAVNYPGRGKCILMSTDTSLDPLEIIKLYGLRFKIEYSFKQAVRTIGAYAYHFWMKDMTPLTRNSGNQYMHRKSEKYRKAVKRKIHAYHTFVQAGIIVQGLLQYLSVTYPATVWDAFGSWIRTIRKGVPPSEMVTAIALRNTFPQFLVANSTSSILAKFILNRSSPTRSKAMNLAA